MTTRRPIPFKAICAIARHVLAHRAHFTDCEWKEAVKVMAARQGWEPPTNAELARALDAVERAAAKAGQSRALPVLESAPRPPREVGRELSAAEAVAVLSNLKIELTKRGLPTGKL